MDTRLIAEEKCHSQCWLCPLERFDLELLGIFKPNPSDRNSGEGGGSPKFIVSSLMDFYTSVTYLVLAYIADHLAISYFEDNNFEVPPS